MASFGKFGMHSRNGDAVRVAAGHPEDNMTSKDVKKGRLRTRKFILVVSDGMISNPVGVIAILAHDFNDLVIA
jgi:hypothetical protein